MPPHACYALAHFPHRPTQLSARAFVRRPSGRLHPTGEYVDFRSYEEAVDWLGPRATACFKDIVGRSDVLFELWWLEDAQAPREVRG